MIELKLNGIDENLTLKRENQYSKKDLDDAVQKAQDAAVLSETSADIAIDAKDDALKSANDALLSAQSAKEDADRAEAAAEKAEGLPLSSKSTGNPLKLESAEAPIIDFKINGFTEKIDDKIRSLGQTYGCVDLGSLNWSKSGGETRMRASFTGYKPPTNSDTIPNIYCDKYVTRTNNQVYQGQEGVALHPTANLIFIQDNNYTDANAFKQAMNGVKLYYELAENAIPSEYAIRVDEVGKNLWDEEWELGWINSSTGQNMSGTDCIRTKNYIDIKDATSIYNNGNINSIIAYNSNKERIDNKLFNGISGFYNLPNGTKYVRFFTTQAYGTTYKNNIMISLEEVEYSPYQGQTVFIPTLNPLNEGDYISYHVDGTGVEHRKMGVVDLGTLNWGYIEATKRFYSAGIRTFAKYLGDGYCDRYEYLKVTDAQLTNKQMCIANGKDYPIVYVIDEDFSDANAFKTAMSGVYLIYELNEQTDTALTAEQIAELKKLKTYKGETNISTEELGSIDITYYADNSNAEVVADIQRQVNEKESGSAESYHVYSLEEKIVGEFIDGKPIYEKTIACSFANSTDSSTYVNVGASIDKLIVAQGYAETSSYGFNFNSYAAASSSIGGQVLFEKSNRTRLRLKTLNPDFKGASGYITVQYTKTTDSARSAQPMLLSDDAITEPNNSDTI